METKVVKTPRVLTIKDGEMGVLPKEKYEFKKFPVSIGALFDINYDYRRHGSFRNGANNAFAEFMYLTTNGFTWRCFGHQRAPNIHARREKEMKKTRYAISNGLIPIYFTTVVNYDESIYAGHSLYVNDRGELLTLETSKDNLVISMLITGVKQGVLLSCDTQEIKREEVSDEIDQLRSRLDAFRQRYLEPIFEMKKEFLEECMEDKHRYWESCLSVGSQFVEIPKSVVLPGEVVVDQMKGVPEYQPLEVNIHQYNDDIDQHINSAKGSPFTKTQTRKALNGMREIKSQLTELRSKFPQDNALNMLAFDNLIGSRVYNIVPRFLIKM